MLQSIGVSGIEDLFADIPEEIRTCSELNLPTGLTELELMTHMRELSGQNMAADEHPMFLGAGIYDHFSPAVVRHVINRSEFLTSYTPYQPEVSQGTLQGIYEFQTAICALTGMEIANASMYDGASALAEAVIMASEVTHRPRILLPSALHPGYRRVVETYCRGLDVVLEAVPHTNGVLEPEDIVTRCDDTVAAVAIQQPNFFGCLESCNAVTDAAHAAGALVIAVVNPLSLGLLKPPGEYGADIAVGDGQPLGIPMCFGGPSFGFFACRKQYSRNIPGRIAGATVDRDGNRGFVLTLQTREQHIRREKATSNICTSQQLIALAATVYLSTLGPSGLRKVGDLCMQKAHYTRARILSLPGFEDPFNRPFFNEFAFRCPVPVAEIRTRLQEQGISGGCALDEEFPELENAMLIAVTEKRSREEIDRLVAVLSEFKSSISGEGIKRDQ